MSPVLSRQSASAPPPGERATIAKLASFRRSLLYSSGSEPLLGHVDRNTSVQQTSSSDSCDTAGIPSPPMTDDQAPNGALRSVSIKLQNLEPQQIPSGPTCTRSHSPAKSMYGKPRPKSSEPSLRVVSNRPASFRSTSSRTGSHRHALLKKSGSPQHQSTEKDLPASPVLTRTHTSDLAAQSFSIPTRSSAPVDPSKAEGDQSVEVADVDLKSQGDHTSTLETLPTSDALTQLPVRHEGHSDVSKVYPADLGDHKATTQQSDSQDVPAHPQASSLDRVHHGHSPPSMNHLELDRPSSGASRQNSDPSQPHEGHDPVAEQASHQEPEDTSKAASYWGFILESLNGKQEAPTANSDAKPALQDHPSMAAAQDADKGETLEGPMTTIISSNRQENEKFDVPRTTSDDLREQGEKTTHQEKRPSSLDVLQDQLSASQQQRDRQLSTAFDSREPDTATLGKEGQPKRWFLPEGLDPKRTAQWLRELLQGQESKSPSLTKRPEKLHPRHEEHGHADDDHQAEALIRRITTFSEKNAADQGAMNKAMENLEQLLQEALHIANDAAEPDDEAQLSGRGHVDDGHLPLRRKDTPLHGHDDPYPRSVHESAQSDSSTDESGLFVDAVEVAGPGGETIRLRSKRRDLEPDMHSGNIRGPVYPIRRSSRVRKAAHRRKTGRESKGDSPVLPMPPPDSQLRKNSARHDAYEEDVPKKIAKPRVTGDLPNSREVREYIRIFHQPPIAPRDSSVSLHDATKEENTPAHWRRQDMYEERRRDADVCSLDGGGSDEVVDFSTAPPPGQTAGPSASAPSQHSTAAPTRGGQAPRERSARKGVHVLKSINLRGRSHVSIRDMTKFSLTKSNRRQPIARDWSTTRKRFVAAVACISTALIGFLVGIYAGIVPAVQYYIADPDHYTILGNVGMFLGLAIPTFFFWPLPLLHGRKPYILSGLAIAMPLLFPQAIAVSTQRMSNLVSWRLALLLPRALMGIALGFANMNFYAILTDLFGASLMSSNPHQEVVDEFDVRRHGGGLGVWLGIWTWCFVGSLGVGFLVGAVIINTLSPDWGLYISIICIAVVMLLNVLTPEVRRSAWRRSVAEVRSGSQVSRRVARGEVMMHRVKDGPTWWGQEAYHGAALALEMLRQPGFALMAVYSAWIYAQVVLVIVLLGSLTSKYYRFKSPHVGACVSSVAIGALVAVPFQKANLFSRARYSAQPSNTMTIDKKVTWTSHLVRRAVFTLVLPVAGIMYAVVSSGPPDCSDLHPGMTGRSKSMKFPKKRTNYSSFPRVQAGYSIIHSLGFVFAAGATGIGGMAQRNLGQRAATAVVAAILLILSVLLLGVLFRFKKIQIIPSTRAGEMDKWTDERRASIRRRSTAIAAAKATGRKDLNGIPEDDVGWRPLIIGNPLEKDRRMNVLELGALTRWSEVRRKNRLIDQSTHLNRQALEMARDELEQKGQEILGDVQRDLQRGGAMVGELVRKVSGRSLRNKKNRQGRNSPASSSNEGAGQTTRRIPLDGIASSSSNMGHHEGHGHYDDQSDVYTERECYIGQSVPEEAEGTYSGELETTDDEYLRHYPGDDTAHMMSTVQPHAGFEQQEVSGQPPAMDTGEGGVGEHASHMAPKVQPAELGESEQGNSEGVRRKSTKSSSGKRDKKD